MADLGEHSQDAPTCCGLPRAEWLLIVVAAAVLLANIVAARPLQSANDRSRWATVWALVERGTFQIDEIDANPAFSTIDKVQHDGHLYSSKPPLLSVAVAGVYWGLKTVAGYDLVRDTEASTRWCLLVVNWLPTVCGWIAFAGLARRVTEDRLVRTLMLVVMGFGTLVTSYTTTLNNHSPGAVCLMFSLGPLWTVLHGTPRRCDFAWLGFWAASVACFELPAALFGALCFLLAAKRDWRRACVWLVPAALLPIAAYLVTNGLATGSWKPFYASYGTDKYLFVRDGIPSYWMNPRGLDRNLDAPLTYFLHCTIGHHGILSLTPVFCLTLLSACRRRWWKGTTAEPMQWLTAGLTVVVLGFYLSRTENYNYGGNTFGLRWIIWLSPLWVLAAVPAFERLVRHKLGLCVIALVLAVSTYSAQSAAKNPWGESWLFHQMAVAGWIDYSEAGPQLELGRPLQTWFADLTENASVVFRAPSTDLSRPLPTESLTVTSLPRESADGKTLHPLKFEWRAISGSWSLTARLDVAKFNRGDSVSDVLQSFESSGGHKRGDVVNFLRGVPVERPYHPGAIRYLKTPLQKDAIRTQRAASQVRVESKSLGTVVTYRSDLWLCTEVPFGVLQVEWLQTSASGEELGRRKWVLREMKGVGSPGPTIDM